MPFNELPALPKKRKTTEADVTPKILDYFRKNFRDSCAIEIKATTGNNIPRSALQRHQEIALKSATTSVLCHKISDASRSRLPFDAFMLYQVPAFVVAAFIRHKIALVIPIDNWQGATPHTLAAYKIPL